MRLGPACCAALRVVCLAGLAIHGVSGAGLASSLKSDEEVVLFPTAARLDGEGARWVLPVHAWVFEPERDSLLRRGALVAAALALGLDETAAESDIFRERVSWFLVDNERGKHLDLTLSADALRLGPTGSDGHFRAELTLERRGEGPEAAPFWLDYGVVPPPGDSRRFTGRALFVPAEGLSVISDIDDTVKISEVTDKQALLANTFLKPFAAAPGMPALFRGLEQRGAVFHYVSSSPWQLYPALAEFLAAARLPAGSIDLKPFRLKDETFFNLFKSSAETKPPVIEALLAAYPGRGFVLVGDSGEVDPEVYGAIARRHPDQVRAILIRNVTGEAPDAARFRDAAFKDLPPELWLLFENAAVAQTFLQRRLGEPW